MTMASALSTVVDETIAERIYYFAFFRHPRTFLPMTHFRIVPVGIVTYLLTIYWLREFMRYRKPIKLNFLLGIHNLFLCGLSLFMSVMLGWEAYRLISEHSIAAAYCGTMDDEIDVRMAMWNILFYLSKYYELLDTVFLVLRKRPLSVLHLYHHCVVLPVCWMGCWSQIFMGWITSFNNASVHVLMYFYYAMSAFGFRGIFSPNILTALQITQFVVDIMSSLGFIYVYFFTDIPCRGDIYSWMIANTTGLTFFYLFSKLYYDRYIASKQKKQ